MRIAKTTLVRGIRTALIICALLVAWEIVVATRVISPASLARPSEVAVAFPRLLTPSDKFPDLASTIVYAVIAFWASVPLGVGIGAITYYVASVRDAFKLLIDFLRSIPATALAPVFLMLVGVGDRTKVVAGLFSSTLVIALATIHGLAGTNKTRAEVARCLALSPPQRVAWVDLPGAADAILIGCRTGISLALILVVVTEMLIGANRGLGRLISDNHYTDDKPLMFAALLATGLVGYVFNVALNRVDKSIVHWRGY